MMAYSARLSSPFPKYFDNATESNNADSGAEFTKTMAMNIERIGSTRYDLGERPLGDTSATRRCYQVYNKQK